MEIISIKAINHILQFSLYDMSNESVIVSGLFERIGLDGSSYSLQYRNHTIKEELKLNNYHDTTSILINKLIDLEIINSLEDIDAIGFYILSGKEDYKKTTYLSDEVINNLEEYDSIFSMKDTIESIRTFKEMMPNSYLVGVFDNAFYQSMKEENYIYGVPYKWYKEYGIRKYGYQGINHQSIYENVKSLLQTSHFKMISCYLGHDGSVCAIDDGSVVDVSMGFSPISGIMMESKSGDIDFTIIPYVMEKEGKNVLEVIDDLRDESGLLGLSEKSSHMTDIIDLCNQEDEKAILARNKYVRKVVDYIAEYYVLLGGVDIIAFSGGIGSNSVTIRREICERLKCLNIEIDLDKNNVKDEIAEISTSESATKVYLIPSSEQYLIAKETVRLVNR